MKLLGLTKDAKYLLISIYKVYKDKRKDNLSKSESKYFGHAEELHSNYFDDWHMEDFLDTCRELSRNGYLKCVFASNTIASINLTDDAIVYNENRYKNNYRQLVQDIGDLKKLIF